jgi:hypothetical protein
VTTGGDVLGDLVEEEALGRAVPDRDVQGWIDAIESILDEASSQSARLEAVRSRFAWSTVVEPLAELIEGVLPAPRYPPRVVPLLGAYVWSALRGTLLRRGVGGTIGEVATILRRPHVP